MCHVFTMASRLTVVGDADRHGRHRKRRGATKRAVSQVQQALRRTESLKYLPNEIFCPALQKPHPPEAFSNVLEVSPLVGPDYRTGG